MPRNTGRPANMDDSEDVGSSCLWTLIVAMFFLILGMGLLYVAVTTLW